MGREEVEKKLAALRQAQLEQAQIIAPKAPEGVRWSPLDWSRAIACSLQQGQPMLIGRDKAGKPVKLEVPLFFDTLVDMHALLKQPLSDDDIDHLGWLEALAVYQRTTGFIVERYAKRHGFKPSGEGIATLQEEQPP